MASSLRNAQIGNSFLESLLESKILSFNTIKSVFLVIGKQKVVRQINENLLNTPLMLCGEKMKKVKEYSYLGETISEQGVSASVTSTVNRRIGRVKQMIFEITRLSDVIFNKCVYGK